MFKDAYRRRRCILPVDGFYEWKAKKGQRAKQPYALAMKDGQPFGIGGLWENWKEPTSGEWVRTFVVITTDANELVAQIHNRMPLIIAPKDYVRWLSEEPDPRELMVPFQADADVANLYSRQQAGERRSIDCQADQVGQFCCLAPAALLRRVMEPKESTFPISVVPCSGCTACCHGPIMLHPGLGDDAANYETELTPYGMKLKQKLDGSCIYLDDHKCSIWPNTPAVCRAFDCRAYVRAGLHLRDSLGDDAVTAAGKARL